MKRLLLSADGTILHPLCLVQLHRELVSALLIQTLLRLEFACFQFQVISVPCQILNLELLTILRLL
jgi:hypothetical protein